MKNEGESDPKVNSEIGRFEQIESTLDEFRDRLNRIERRLGPEAAPAPSAAPVPPPVMKAEAPKPPPRFDFQSYRPPATVAMPAPKADLEDAEFRFGSVVLPRVGAGVVLLGIAYLVGLGIANGWITVWHQFIGAILLCLASIAVGLWKRAEGFEFGQVLVGLGSCGLYLTFAGGHAFLKLYEGEALVLQFLVLSLANLAYGAITPSKTFVGIGLLGGLAASLMPMQQDNVALSLMLHLAILLPTAAVVAHRKWPGMAVGAWLVSTCAILWPALEKVGVWQWQLAAVYGASLLVLMAYSFAHDDWQFDPGAAFIPFAALATGLLAVVVSSISGDKSTAHLLLFGGAMAASGFLFRREAARHALWLGGLLAPFVFAPVGLESMERTWTYLGLAAAAALMSFRAYPKATFGFSILGLALSAVMYLARIASGSTIPLGQESAFLLAAIGTIILIAYSAHRQINGAEAITFGAALVLSPVLARMSALLLGQPEVGASLETALISAALPLSAAGAILAMRRGWPLMAAFSWLSMATAAVAYLVSFEQNPLSFSVELWVLGSTMATLFLASGAIVKTGGQRDAAGVIAVATAFPLFTRLVYLLATDSSVGMAGSAAVTLAWTTFATLSMIVGFSIDLRSVRIAGLSIFGLTLGKVLLYDLSALDPGIRVGLLILLGIAMIGGGYWYIRRTGPTQKPPAVVA